MPDDPQCDGAEGDTPRLTAMPLYADVFPPGRARWNHRLLSRDIRGGFFHVPGAANGFAKRVDAMRAAERALYEHGAPTAQQSAGLEARRPDDFGWKLMARNGRIPCGTLSGGGDQ
ncbi:hypothetical protein [Azospirillum tabaci]|uniref:hypothetical protein n=1 Tax=Azospirillum tabaci TaxID=2752310 RepID=UPI001660D683|nr:hypothetical protein [Azospirillum tabaci]